MTENGGTLGVFLLITVLLGGGAAWLTGRAIAFAWRPWWQVAAAALLLGAVARFFHFALFGATLLSPPHYLLDAAVCLLLGLVGYRITRSRQMTEQYGWLYRRAGPFNWARQPAAPNAAHPESG